MRYVAHTEDRNRNAGRSTCSVCFFQKRCFDERFRITRLLRLMTFNGRHRSKNSSESSEAKVSPSIPDNTTKKKREGNSRGTEATGERDECYEPEDVEIPRQKLKTEDLDRDKGSVTVVARNTSSNTGEF